MKRLALMASCAALLLPASALAKDYAHGAEHHPIGPVRGRPHARGRCPGEDVRRPDATVRQGHHRGSHQGLQVRAARGQGHTEARDGRRRSRARACASCATVQRPPHLRQDPRPRDLGDGLGGRQEDRRLLLDQARGPARIAALDAPGIDASTCRRAEDVRAERAGRPDRSRPADRASQERGQARQGAAPRHRHVRQGRERRYKFTSRRPTPFTRNDIYATNALAGQLFGRGGGNEVHRSMLLSGLDQRLGEHGATCSSTTSPSTTTPTRPRR